MKEEVIAQFNEEVNMTADELEAWLEDPESAKAGTGVGIDSGHKIVEILKKNPTKDPEKYDEEDPEHMRKVVGYNTRHLAQEDHLKETETREELENATSTISLKNWGHDSPKTLDERHGDEPSADSGSNGDDGHDEPQTQDDREENMAEEGGEVDGKEEVSGEEEDQDEPKSKEVKKRKLDGEELEPDEGEAGKGSIRCADDQELETGENGGVSETVEGQNRVRQDEPPRKKAKNDAAQ